MPRLKDADDLLEKLRTDHARVHADLADEWAAYDAAVTSWHFAEWVWGERVKGRSDLEISYFGTRHFRDLEPQNASQLGVFFKHWALQTCDPYLGAMEQVANGLKHFRPERPKPHAGGIRFGGGGPPLGTVRLVIDGRYFDDSLNRVVAFWEEVVSRL